MQKLFVEILQQALLRIGEDPQKYLGHSFRIYLGIASGT